MQTLEGMGKGGALQASQAGKTPSCAHSVLFYEDSSVFLDKLAEFVRSALGSAGACIVIATAEHRRGLADRLAGWAGDIRLSARSGRYAELDAAETLAGLMVDGRPNRELFDRTLEPVIARAQAALTRKAGGKTGHKTRVVSAFGEMVALLWDAGHYDGVLQLEEFWNDLADRCGFSLLCAYPMSCFSRESEYEFFSQVCDRHAHVIPAESYSSLPTDAERMRMISSLQQKAALMHNAMEERERAIAQRKHAEDKLWRSDEFARKVVESCIDCVKVLDLQGRLEYMSPSGQTAMEIPDLSLYLGRSWLTLWEEGDRQRVEDATAVARGGGVGSFQADSATVHGIRKHWDVRVTPARGRDGAIERLIAASRDITELRQAQQIAVQAEKLAAAGRMAATIAHEVNNPLEAVTNFIYLARTTPALPQDAAGYLEIADRELTRVAQIAQKTLGFYRDTSKNKWVSLKELVDDVFLVYERKLRYKQMTSEIDIEPGLKVFVKQGELKQALSNLVANAIDAAEEGGAIWLRAHACSNWARAMEAGIRITLADNGVGMTPEVQKRIFVPFFTTKANVGTGIGLWVTKSLIEQQGGSLHFRSRQGPHHGTVMSFFLPVSPAADALEAAA